MYMSIQQTYPLTPSELILHIRAQSSLKRTAQQHSQVHEYLGDLDTETGPMTTRQ